MARPFGNISSGGRLLTAEATSLENLAKATQREVDDIRKLLRGSKLTISQENGLSVSRENELSLGLATSSRAGAMSAEMVGRIEDLESSSGTVTSTERSRWNSAFNHSLITGSNPHSTPHNTLASIQGGASGEYYHLTSAEYTVMGTLEPIGTANQLLGVNAAGTALEYKAGLMDASGNLTNIGTISSGAITSTGQSTFTSNDGAFGLLSHSADAGEIDLEFYKSRSSGVITTGDRLLRMVAKGHDGTSYVQAGRMDIVSYGTIGTGRVAGRINFYATQDQASPSQINILSLDATAATVTGNLTVSGTIGSGAITSSGTLTVNGAGPHTIQNTVLMGQVRSTVNSGSAALVAGTSTKSWTWYPSGTGLRLFEYNTTIGAGGGNDRITVAAGGDVTLGSNLTVSGTYSGSGDITIQKTGATANIILSTITSGHGNIIFNDNASNKWLIGWDRTTDNLRFRNASLGEVVTISQTGAISSGAITSDTPTWTKLLMHTSGSLYGRVAQDANSGVWLASNAVWTGTVWNRDDVAYNSFVFANGHIGNDRWEWRSAVAGANPISFTNAMTLTRAGSLTLAGNLTVSGTVTGVGFISTEQSANGLILSRNTDNSGGPGMIGRKSRGSLGTPTAISANDVLFQLRTEAYVGGAYRDQQQYTIEAVATIGATFTPTQHRWYTTNNAGTSAERMVLDKDGNLTANGNLISLGSFQTLGTGSFGGDILTSKSSSGLPVSLTIYNSVARAANNATRLILGLTQDSQSSFILRHLQSSATDNDSLFQFIAPDASVDLTWSRGGVFTFASNVIMSAPIRLKNYTVATLPAGTQGDTAFVTDALAPAFLTAVVGGGAAVVPVFYDGTNWVAI